MFSTETTINQDEFCACTKCNTKKSLSCFYKKPNGSIYQWCKECRSKCHLEYRKNNSELVSFREIETARKYRDGHREIIRERARERSRKYRLENKAKCYEARNRWGKLNRDITRIISERWRKKHGHEVLLRKNYGMTLEHYEAMLLAQGGGCGICGRKDLNSTGRKLAVDHDHKNGCVRGLLCNRCNLVLGLLNDDSNFVLKMASYLKRHGR